MKLKSLFIIFLTIFLLAAGGYFGYQYHKDHSLDKPLTIIPTNAYAVVIVDPSKKDSNKYEPSIIQDVKTHYAAQNEEGPFAFSLHPSGRSSDWIIYVF